MILLLLLDFITFYSQQSNSVLVYFCDQAHRNAEADGVVSPVPGYQIMAYSALFFQEIG